MSQLESLMVEYGGDLSQVHQESHIRGELLSRNLDNIRLKCEQQKRKLILSNKPVHPYGSIPIRAANLKGLVDRVE